MALKDVGVRLVVEGTGAFKSKMQSAGSSIDRFGAKIKDAGANLRSIGLGLTVMGGAITGILGMAVKEASDAEEMMSKFRVVFRDQAMAVEDWATTLAEGVNRSRFEIMAMAASLQDTFVPMGFARDQAAGLSKDLTELAIDVASFNNKLDTEVMRDFQSALVGNTETVRKYGIVITAVQVEQDILNRGLVRNKSEITEAMKVQARYNMIVAGSADAIGDAARTSGSFANQMKGIKAAVKEVAVMTGNVLLPILSRFIKVVSSIIKGIAGWMREHKLLSSVMVIGAGTIGLFMLAIGPLLIALPSLVTGFTILRAFMLTKFIPTVVAATAALWAKVTALLAILAAAGPVGWVILASAIALIGTVAVGAAVAIGNLSKRTQEATGNTQALADAAQSRLDMTAQSFNGVAEAAGITAVAIADANRQMDIWRGFSGGIAAAFRQAPEAVRQALDIERQRQIQRRGTFGPGIFAAPSGVRTTVNNTYNVEASYTNPQDPATIALDLELLTLEAAR